MELRLSQRGLLMSGLDNFGYAKDFNDESLNEKFRAIFNQLLNFSFNLYT
jgi:hypothetical protein